MTDPIGAMLINLKNAGNAGKDIVQVPYSNIKNSIAEFLLSHGFVSGVSKKTKKGFLVLELSLSYNDKAPRITEVKRISKPSRRMYMGVKNIKPIKNGYGMIVLSTPKGIMGDKEARKAMVGGEVLFSIW